MKIEMGESLFYSWLRHVKECQIVQTNWKVSSQWNFQYEKQLEYLMNVASQHFKDKYGYNIFKQNSSLTQIIQQAECDALGISIQNGVNNVYAVDVAFHVDGLNYGTREETVMKVISKSIRTAMCLYGYLDITTAEIIFASPKITPSILGDLIPCVEDINSIFKQHGLNFSMRIIANEDFNNSVLKPILLVSSGIADTTELFIRGYQMFTMFDNKKPSRPKHHTSETNKSISHIENNSEDAYKELKIGKIANVILRDMLTNGFASKSEILSMQDPDYCKRIFHLNYPLLVKSNSEYECVRYYAKPLIINEEEYMLCSQWFETPANNDRPYLLNWIIEHQNL